jgi:hypothetical protein
MIDWTLYTDTPEGVAARRDNRIIRNVIRDGSRAVKALAEQHDLTDDPHLRAWAKTTIVGLLQEMIDALTVSYGLDQPDASPPDASAE